MTDSEVLENLKGGLRCCEIAIGIIAKEPLTAATATDLNQTYYWLQSLHTKIQNEVSEKTKSETPTP